MDITDYIILKNLSESKNLTKTSEFMYMSQPALTYRIQKIEKYFDLKLFIRRKQGLEFTPEGTILADYANKMIVEHRKVTDQLKNNNTISGVVRIGVSNNFARYRLPKLLKDFYDKYPEIEFNVQTGWSGDIVKLLEKDSIHIGFVRGEQLWSGEKTLLSKEDICIVSKKPLSFDEIPSLPYIKYNTDKKLENEINFWWNNTFTYPPKTIMKVDRVDTAKELVKYNLGFSIFPSICLLDSDNFNVLTISGDKNEILKSRTTYMMNKKESEKLVFLQVFIDFIKKHYNTLNV